MVNCSERLNFVRGADQSKKKKSQVPSVNYVFFETSNKKCNSSQENGEAQKWVGGFLWEKGTLRKKKKHENRR